MARTQLVGKASAPTDRSRQKLFAAASRQYGVSVCWLRLIDSPGTLDDADYLRALVEAEDRGIWSLVNPDVRTQLQRYLPKGRTSPVLIEILVRQCGLSRGDLLRKMVDIAEIRSAPQNANYRREHSVLAAVVGWLERVREDQERAEWDRVRSALATERVGRTKAEQALKDQPKALSANGNKARQAAAGKVGQELDELLRGVPRGRVSSHLLRKLDQLRRQHASDPRWRKLLGATKTNKVEDDNERKKAVRRLVAQHVRYTSGQRREPTTAS